MIKIENINLFGWEAAIRGMRNPLNSWGKSDSYQWYGCDASQGFEIGPNDMKLMKNLVKAGSDHGKFMRMITVSCDITAPLYWWKEYDTYKVGTVANSCSTMHKIQAKEFTLDDFSHEHLLDTFTDNLKETIESLNIARNKFLETNNKNFWWQMIQLLPSSYNQRRTVMLNYAVLRNMYHSRKYHKLDEWVAFCRWIEKLPYSELITKNYKDESGDE